MGTETVTCFVEASLWDWFREYAVVHCWQAHDTGRTLGGKKEVVLSPIMDHTFKECMQGLYSLGYEVGAMENVLQIYRGYGTKH